MTLKRPKKKLLPKRTIRRKKIPMKKQMMKRKGGVDQREPLLEERKNPRQRKSLHKGHESALDNEIRKLLVPRNARTRQSFRMMLKRRRRSQPPRKSKRVRRLRNQKLMKKR
jgi:hypothetical protein